MFGQSAADCLDFKRFMICSIVRWLAVEWPDVMAFRQPFGGGQAIPHFASCWRVHPPLGDLPASICCSVSLMLPFYAALRS